MAGRHIEYNLGGITAVPVAYRIFPLANLTVLRFWGTASARSAETLIGDMRVHPDFRPGFDGLIDVREMQQTDQGAAEFTRDMTQLAEDARQARRVLHHAVLTRAWVGKPMAQMHKNFSDAVPGLKVRVFDDPQAAAVWLKLPGEVSDYLDHDDWTLVIE